MTNVSISRQSLVTIWHTYVAWDHPSEMHPVTWDAARELALAIGEPFPDKYSGPWPKGEST